MDNNVERKHCSFCGKRGRKGTRFAGGLGAMICEQCVEHYHEVFASSARSRKAARPPWESMSDEEILAALPLIAQTAKEVDEFLVEWVELARSRKLSWAAIGAALGMSRQSAWERYAQRVAGARGNASSTA